MQPDDVTAILKRMAGYWGEPKDDNRLKAYRDWLERTDAGRSEVMEAIALLADQEEFWPKPVKLRRALQEVGALGEAHPGMRDPRLVAAHMKSVEEVGGQVSRIRGISFLDAVHLHLAEIRDQHEEMVRYDIGDKGWFIDRIEGCERVLSRETPR